MKPTAFCINLGRRPERWCRFQELWNPFFNLVRYPAFDGLTQGALGCKLSHVGACEEALKRSPLAIVMEDDCEMTPFWDRCGMRCIAEAESSIHNWDMISCGPYLNLSVLGLSPARLERTPSPLLLRTSYFQQTHFMCYNQRSVGLLMSSLESRLPLDMFLGRTDSVKLVPIRLLAKQGIWPSDIRQPPFDTSNLYNLSEEMLRAAAPKCDLP